MNEDPTETGDGGKALNGLSPRKGNDAPPSSEEAEDSDGDGSGPRREGGDDSGIAGRYGVGKLAISMKLA